MDMRQMLQQILQRYGTSVIEEPGRFAAMLNDLRRGEGKREANLLLLALREGVPDRLLSAGEGVPMAPLVGQLARRLVDDVGLTDELALWAVESWALAFGLRFERQPVPAPATRSAPPLGAGSAPSARSAPPPAAASAPATRSAPPPAAAVAPPPTDPRSRLLALIRWVDVPAGPFLYGVAKGRRTLAAFRIMQTPVTVAMYRAYCAAAGVAMPPAPSWGWRDDHPVVNVSWTDAQGFCRWSGLALPTEEQWEKAARGTEGREYPWGNDWDPRRCVCSVGPARATSTAPVGSIASAASPFGCLDMAGNVLEWCRDWYEGSKFPLVRGGGWDYRTPANFHTHRRFWFSPTAKFSSQGFRCVVPDSPS